MGAEARRRPPRVDGVPLTRYWLIPSAERPKIYMPHPAMSADEIRQRHASGVGIGSTACRDLAALVVCAVAASRGWHSC